MKKIFLYSLMLASALSVFTSCKDDDTVSGDANRLFMPMFRTTPNTGSSTTPYYCDIASKVDPNIETYLAEHGYKASTHVNDMRLFWYAVEGAEAYQLRAKVQGTQWDRDEVLDTILSPDQLSFLHEDLQYSTGYLYAIRALADKNNLNDPRNSKWYGYGDGSHQQDMSRDDSRGQTGALNTGDRYEVPAVMWIDNLTENSCDVYFNPQTEDKYDTGEKEADGKTAIYTTWDKWFADFMEAGGEIATDGSYGKCKFDQVRITPSTDNPDLPSVIVNVTDADLARGYVHVEGLQSNAAYIATVMNNDVPRYNDRHYNRTMFRVKGQVGEPILIKYYCDPNDTILQNGGNTVGTTFGCKDLQACRLDTVLRNYMSDNTLAEGQVFYLEGGKTYYMQTTVEMTKGFTLATNPEDLAAGKGRATVLQGVGYSDQAMKKPNTNNLGLCRNAANGSENGVLLAIGSIIIEDINFHPMAWYTWWDKNGTDGDADVEIPGNYFINMYSQGLSFTLDELRIKNCAMAGHVRGFVRFQGPNRQIIHKLSVTGCVFYDEGAYSKDGRGYSWFAGPGNNRNSNFYEDFEFIDNTIINSCRHAIVTENSNLAWPAGQKWNINVSNNTFINFGNMSFKAKQNMLFETAYPPKGSKFTCKKNLFVQVKNSGDSQRSLLMKGMFISQFNGVSFDFADNYSCYVPEYTSNSVSYKASDDAASNLLDKMWAMNSFSDNKNGAGYNKGALNVGGLDETKIKFGDNINGNEPDAVGYQLKAEELFKNPTPKGSVNTEQSKATKDAYRHDVNGFYYNNTERVKNHPIYTKQIGASCWRTGAAWDGGKNHIVKSGDKTF